MILGLGFPVIVFWKVYRRRARLHASIVVSRYGYFYQSYYAGFAYWASLVHLRKAFLAAISVLSLTFSNQLKENIALLVLVFAIALHMQCKPYKEQKLNRIEAGSLVISSIMILLEGITRSPEVSNTFNTTVSVVLILLMIVFLMYMVVELFLAYKRTLHTWVRNQEEYDEHTGGLTSLCKVIINILNSRFGSLITKLRGNLKLKTTGSVELQIPDGSNAFREVEEGEGL